MSDQKKGGPQVRPWDPTGRDKPTKLDPAKFASMTPEQKVDTLIGMIGLIKQFGGDPKQMLREVLSTLSPEQQAQLKADPKTQAQLRALMDML